MQEETTNLAGFEITGLGRCRTECWLSDGLGFDLPWPLFGAGRKLSELSGCPSQKYYENKNPKREIRNSKQT